MKLRRLLRAAIATNLVIAGALDLPAQAQKPSLPGYPAPGGETIVTLLAAGAEPRTQLRYRLRPSQQETTDVTMQIGMAMSIGELSVPVDMPPIIMSVRTSVNDLAANGDITYAIAFTRMTVEAGGNEAVAATLKQAVASLLSVKGTGVVSNRGVPRSVKIDASGITDPTMKQTFDQMATSFQNMSMPMPDEAVGVGGRWEVRNAIDSGGATLFQKTEYEIVSIDGPTLTLKARIEQTAPPQSVTLPGAPAGVAATLSKMSGSGSGTLTLRLDALTARGSMESASSMSMDVTDGAQSQSMTAQMKLKVTVAPGK